MVIPPPNVTGSLHMGHALNHTLPDIIARWKRMQGYDVLWLPGTDHAGIATQNVVEKQLAQEGKTRHDLGREAFEARVWEWVRKSHGTITGQMRKLGESVDWSRERFTLDEQLSRAVRRVFVTLYNEGLDLPRHLHRELVPALPHGAVGPRGRAQGHDGQAVVRALPGGRRRPRRDGGDDAARDDARRHGDRGEPRRTSATATGSARRCACRSSAASCRSSATSSWTRRSAPAR